MDRWKNAWIDRQMMDGWMAGRQKLKWRRPKKDFFAFMLTFYSVFLAHLLCLCRPSASAALLHSTTSFLSPPGPAHPGPLHEPIKSLNGFLLTLPLQIELPAACDGSPDRPAEWTSSPGVASTRQHDGWPCALTSHRDAHNDRCGGM